MAAETKVVLIKGGCAGIGESTALKYAKMGYKVAITGRNVERLNKVLDSLVAETQDKDKSNFLAIQADFEDPAQVDKVVEKVIEKFQQLNIVVNNAGYGGKGIFVGIEDEHFFELFQKVIQVDLLAATRISQLALPFLKITKGVIINITGIGDRMPIPTISSSVSKAGLSMMTKALASALDGQGVRVVCVAPGPVASNFAPIIDRAASLNCLGRVGTSEEIADFIIFLASDKGIFIHGSTIDIDGGMLVKFGGLYEQFRKLVDSETEEI